MEGSVRWIVPLAAAALLGGCGGDRARPFDPGPGDSGPTLSATPLVRITDPVEGTTILKEAFTNPPGRRVVLEGTFIPGHEIKLEGYGLQYGPIPFDVLVYDVMEEGVRLTTHLQAGELHLTASTNAVLRVDVFDENDRVISTDSIQIGLR